MSTNTPNLNIPKPNGNEFFNRTNFNQILDVIDSNVKAKLDEKDTPASVQEKINTAIATLINNSPSSLDTLKELADALGDDPNFATTILNRLTTDEQTVAVHLAENATLTTKGHVQLSSSTSSTSEIMAATPKAIKTVNDSIAPTIEQDSYKTIKSGKDTNGIYTTVQQKRKTDGTLVRQSVLSGGTSPNYTTRTVTFYGTDGTTVIKTDTFTLSYDTDGVLQSEV